MCTTPFDRIMPYSSICYEWIRSKCSFVGNIGTIKINKISVISFQCLLNFGSISIMPFHQCTRFDEYVWRNVDDISMFRSTLPCGPCRRGTFKEPEVKSIWYLLYKNVFTLPHTHIHTQASVSFYRARRRDFSLFSFLFLFDFYSNFEVQMYSNVCGRVRFGLFLFSRIFCYLFFLLLLNTNHTVRYKNVVIVVIFILRWNGPCKWYKS